MMDEALFTKILEIIVLAFPSIVTLLVLLNRKFYMKHIDAINVKIDGLEKSNIERNQSVIKRLDQQQEKIKTLLQSKDIADKIRDITRHAIQYVGDRKLSKIIENSTQQFIDLTVSVLQQGFNKLSKEQILAKINRNRDNSMAYVKSILNKEEYEKWLPLSKPVVDNFVKSTFEIYDDPVNDKNSRFLIKAQDYAQTLTREFISFAASLKYPQEPDKNENLRDN